MRKDVCGLVVVELARQNVLVVQRTVLILDVNNVGNVLAGIVLTGYLFEQLVGGNIERFHLDARILLHEGIGDLGHTGGDGVNGYLALFLGLFVQLCIGFVGVEDAGGLFPLAQLERARSCRCVRILNRVGDALCSAAATAAARGQREHHRCCQNAC